MVFWNVFIISVLSLILVITVTFAAAGWQKYNSCLNEPNIWCYNDWTCPGTQSTDPSRLDYWPGVAGVYNNVNGVCTFPGGTGGTGLPTDCNCTWGNWAYNPNSNVPKPNACRSFV